MTPATRREFLSIIAHGHPADVRHYQDMARAALKGCATVEEAEEFWPFGENPSSLAYAIWRIERADYFNEGDGRCRSGRKAKYVQHWGWA